MNNKVLKIAIVGLMAALAYIAFTFLQIKIPTPAGFTSFHLGNTFCASIPIAMADMKEAGLINNGDKIILLGYGGGLNTGSILFEY